MNNIDSNFSNTKINIRIKHDDELFEKNIGERIEEHNKEKDFINSQNNELNNNINIPLNSNKDTQHFNLNENKISNNKHKIKITLKKEVNIKKIEKSDFENSIQFFEYIDGKNQKQKYSLNKYNSNNHRYYYNCSDSLYKGRGIITFLIDDSKNLFETIKNENFKIVRDHNSTFEEHSYIFKNQIDRDYSNLSKNILIEILKDYK